jgi:transposase-like protein
MQKPRARSSPTYLLRRRWTADDARAALAAMARSGLSPSAFAREEGLDLQRLMRWRRQLAAAPTFEEVIPIVPTAPLLLDTDGAADGAAERFEIVLTSGRVVRVPASFEASALRRLLGVVDEVGAC